MDIIELAHHRHNTSVFGQFWKEKDILLENKWKEVFPAAAYSDLEAFMEGMLNVSIINNKPSALLDKVQKITGLSQFEVDEPDANRRKAQSGLRLNKLIQAIR
jgi:hypothetical protein